MKISKVRKLFKIVRSRSLIDALIKGSAAGVEHLDLLNQLQCETLVDIGANTGQFALAARYTWPGAQIYSFEPLVEPANIYLRIFDDDDKAKLFPFAIGLIEEQVMFHVSNMDDSSSILPISHLQSSIFPGTHEVETRKIQLYPLDKVLSKSQIKKPAMMKIDVQGYELNVLRGCEHLLNQFDYIYVECSFIELYENQPKAYEVIQYLHSSSFQLSGVYNLFYDKRGMAIQGDFLFQNSL